MSIADKLHQRQMALRKKSGLPHPDYYKELGHSYSISDDKERLAKQSEIKKKYKVEEVESLREYPEDLQKMKKADSYKVGDKIYTKVGGKWHKGHITTPLNKVGNHGVKFQHNGKTHSYVSHPDQLRLHVEEVEQLDEMPESSMKTRDVHAHLKKSGWSLARSSGGHDVYKHPKAKHSIPVPRHNQLKAPLIRGIMKASRVSEEAEVNEQLYKKGRFVSGPVKKPFKSSTIATPIREAKDPREYDYEGDMAMSQLRSLMFNAQDLIDMMDDNTNLPEWVQSKITLAEDYISTAANYLRGELNEAANPAQQAAIAINMKKKGIKPKNEEVELDENEDKVNARKMYHKHFVASMKSMASSPKQKHHQAEMEKYKAMMGNSFLDQVAPKKFAKFDKKTNEEVELTEGRPSQRHPLEGHEYHKKTDAELEYIGKDAHKAAEAMKGHNEKAENKYRDQANDAATVRYFRKKSGTPDWYKKKYGHVKEDIEYLEEKNAPTNPALWSKAKSLARSKFDVYPSAYANGWAAKWYKSKGGGWKTVSEDVDDPSAAARTLSRKAQIVKDAAKGKKQEQEQASDKFQKDPELSSDIQKT